MTEEDFNAPILAEQHFYWGNCLICKRTSSVTNAMKRCTRCKAAFYCSQVGSKYCFSFLSAVTKNLWGYITVCPRSSCPFYMVTYYMKWVATSWTYGMIVFSMNKFGILRVSFCSFLTKFTLLKSFQTWVEKKGCTGYWIGRISGKFFCQISGIRPDIRLNS